MPIAKVTLFYIGEDYYWKSSTIMSPIYYNFNPPVRCDWGKVSQHLTRGDEVRIYPANTYQLTWADEELKAIQRRLKK